MLTHRENGRHFRPGEGTGQRRVNLTGMRRPALLLAVLMMAISTLGSDAQERRGERLRVIIETDAGGDPDDEQSLVRFLLYCSEWDVEGIIATRRDARVGENLNPVRTGLGIIRAQIDAYGQCYPN